MESSALRASGGSDCLRGTGGLYIPVPHDQAARFPNHQLIFRKSGGHRGGHEHHAELDDYGSNEPDGYARNVCVNFGERLSGSEPDYDHDIHADGHEYHGIGHSIGDSYRDPTEPALDQLVHGKPHKHRIRQHQRAELGDFRRSDDHNHAGDVYDEYGERHNER